MDPTPWLRATTRMLPVVASLVWLPLASAGVDEFPLLWIQIGTFVILAVSAVLGWISFPGPKLFWVALGLTLAGATISTISSMDLDASVPALLLWLWLAAIALLVASTSSSEQKLIGACLTTALIAQTTWGFFVWWGGGDPADTQSGTFYAPNQYAGYLLLLASFLLAPALMVKARREAAAWGLMGSLVCLGVLLSGSRGGMVALTVGVIATFVLAIFAGRREAAARAVVFLGMASLLGLLLTSSLFLKDRSTGSSSNPLENLEAKGSTSPSTQMRIHWMQGAARIGAQHPFTGSGLGTYGDVLVQVQEPTWSWSRYAHNHYAEAFGEGGLAFAIGVIAFPLVAIAAGIKEFRKRPEPLTMAAVAGLLGGSAHLAVDHDWSFPAYAVAYVAVAAVLVSRKSGDDRRHAGLSLKASSLALLVFSAAVIVTLLARERTLHLLNTSVQERAIGFEATRLSPFSAEAYHRLVLDKLNFGDLPSASEAIEEAIARDELDPYLRWRAANIYLQLKDFNRARSAYRNAMRVAPNAPRSYLEAATFELDEMRDPGEAAEVLDMGLNHLTQQPFQDRLNLPISRLLVLRAQAASALGQNQSARSFARQATERSPNSRDPWVALIRYSCITGAHRDMTRAADALRNMGVAETELAELSGNCG